jgi:hypothetical protein
MHPLLSFSSQPVYTQNHIVWRRIRGMAEKEKEISCTTPARGPLVAETPAAPTDPIQPSKEVPRMTARVGKKAPDFEAMAFVGGSFKLVKLSDYAGKWVLVCFYPGDFTFV